MEDEQTVEEIQREYLELCHAMQSGVAMMINYDPASVSPKHLRVGINSALINDSALSKLLVDKGIINFEGTGLEYMRGDINLALVNSSALRELLIKKGIITEREYMAAMRDGMRREVASYEKQIAEVTGYGATNIHLR